MFRPTPHYDADEFTFTYEWIRCSSTETAWLQP
jgi:hypothetical protein